MKCGVVHNIGISYWDLLPFDKQVITDPAAASAGSRIANEEQYFCYDPLYLPVASKPVLNV